MAVAKEQVRGAEGMAGLAEWLQRSLLTPPPPIADVEVAAGYLAPPGPREKGGGRVHPIPPRPATARSS